MLHQGISLSDYQATGELASDAAARADTVLGPGFADLAQVGFVVMSARHDVTLRSAATGCLLSFAQYLGETSILLCRALELVLSAHQIHHEPFIGAVSS